MNAVNDIDGLVWIINNGFAYHNPLSSKAQGSQGSVNGVAKLGML